MRNFVSHSHLSLKDTALLHQLDAIDWKIIKIRQEDGRLSKAELAERVSLSALALLETVNAPGAPCAQGAKSSTPFHLSRRLGRRLHLPGNDAVAAVALGLVKAAIGHLDQVGAGLVGHRNGRGRPDADGQPRA